MPAFIIYNDAGRILQTGEAPEDMIDMQASPGRNVLAGEADQLTQYVLDGVVTDRPPSPATLSSVSVQADGIATLEVQGLPGATLRLIGKPGYAINGLSATFGVPGAYTAIVSQFPYLDLVATVTVVPDLAMLREQKWASIKAARTAAEFSSFTYEGMVFDGDMDAQRRLTAYISVSKSALAAGVPFSADFTLANNEVVNLTAADFVALEMAKVQAVAAAFEYARLLREQIMQAGADALGDIVWAP